MTYVWGFATASSHFKIASSKSKSLLKLDMLRLLSIVIIVITLIGILFIIFKIKAMKKYKRAGALKYGKKGV